MLECNANIRIQPPVLKHETPASGTGRRLNRQSNPTKEVPLGRVVMFCQKKILIIPCQFDTSLFGFHFH